MRKNIYLFIAIIAISCYAKSSDDLFSSEKMLHKQPGINIQIPTRIIRTPPSSARVKISRSNNLEKDKKEGDVFQLPELAPKPPPRIKRTETNPLITVQPPSPKQDYINPFQKKERLLPSIVQKRGRRFAVVKLDTEDTANFK